jgi:tRNA(Ile2) C34 agmatinyltransferase TiaS
VDRASLREGRVVRLWIAALGDETLYETDLPSCCQRSARSAEDSFECPSCGAMWQQPQPVWAEEDAFAESSRERKGAA